MARLLGPDFFNIQVRNLSVSRAFYLDVLGLSEDTSFSVPGVVLFESTTIPFAISEQKGALDQAAQPGLGIALWIDCDNVNELHARMQDAGATIVREPFDGPFGRTLVFTDPDGYQITANANPWERFPLGGKQGR